MSSIAYTEGFYYVPRIDRNVIEQYKDNVLIRPQSEYTGPQDQHFTALDQR